MLGHDRKETGRNKEIQIWGYSENSTFLFVRGVIRHFELSHQKRKMRQFILKFF